MAPLTKAKYQGSQIGVKNISQQLIIPLLPKPCSLDVRYKGAPYYLKVTYFTGKIFGDLQFCTDQYKCVLKLMSILHT